MLLHQRSVSVFKGALLLRIDGGRPTAVPSTHEWSVDSRDEQLRLRLLHFAGREGGYTQAIITIPAIVDTLWITVGERGGNGRAPDFGRHP